MLEKSKLKYIQSLGHKKFRDADGVFVAEGPKIVQELLQSNNTTLLQLYATKEWLPEITYKKELAVEIEPYQLAKISFLSTPNQVLGLFHKPVFDPERRVPGIVLLLDNIQDPGNLGTIVRTADWFGVRRIVCSPDTADLFNPKVVQATMGSISRVEVIYADLAGYLAKYPEMSSYATTPDGNDLSQINNISEGLILIGNESRGLSKELQSMASHRISIPRKGGAESLNAAVATGIILSQVQKN